MVKEVLILCEDLFGLEAYAIIQESNAYIKRERLQSDIFNVAGFLYLKEAAVCVEDAEHNHCTEKTVYPFKDIYVDKPVYTSIEQWLNHGKPDLIMGIKRPAAKEKTSEIIHKNGGKFISILTPWTIVPDHYKIGEGCLISNYSFKDGSVFEDFVTMINVMSETSHVGCFSTIDALTNITSADIGKRVMIGSHSFLMAHLQIGDNSELYPGSIVFGNIKPGLKVAGMPANKAMYKRITGINTASEK